jgi:hypothetical protein
VIKRAALLPCLVILTLICAAGIGEARQDASPNTVNRAAAVGSFLAGALTGLAAHEGGHLLMNVVFDAEPGIDRVDFHGIPFFAITHRPDLTSNQEYIVSAAGFWVQHGTNEWMLTRHRSLRRERAPFKKGLFAFNVLASFAYAGAAFARTGPDERDTRGMAISAGIDEPWIGAFILAPAVLDLWRYYDPAAKLPVWLSRAAKVAVVLLVFR